MTDYTVGSDTLTITPARETTRASTRTLDIGVFGARSVPSTYGGFETFLTTLLPMLVERGHKVTMYCRSTDVHDAQPYKGVRRVSLPAIAGKSLNTLSHGAVSAVAARLARHDVTLVVNVANAPFCLPARRSGQPVVLNTDGQEWLRGKWGKAARSYFLGTAKIARHCATALVCDSAAMRDLYVRDFGSDATVIPYCPPPVKMPDDADVRVSYFGLTPDRYCLVAGRLNPENNIDAVAERYHELDVDVPLVVLGAANYDSPTRRRLEELTASDERIRYIGHVSDRNDFFALVGRAAVYLHGHSVGGINPALIEAMHAGACIIAFDTPFNREALGPIGDQFPLDPAGFAKVLNRALSLSPAERQQWRDAAQQRVVDLFSADAVADAYERVLLAAADAGANASVRVPTQWD